MKSIIMDPIWLSAKWWVLSVFSTALLAVQHSFDVRIQEHLFSSTTMHSDLIRCVWRVKLPPNVGHPLTDACESLGHSFRNWFCVQVCHRSSSSMRMFPGWLSRISPVQCRAANILHFPSDSHYHAIITARASLRLGHFGKVSPLGRHFAMFFVGSHPLLLFEDKFTTLCFFQWSTAHRPKKKQDPEF